MGFDIYEVGCDPWSSVNATFKFWDDSLPLMPLNLLHNTMGSYSILMNIFHRHNSALAIVFGTGITHFVLFEVGNPNMIFSDFFEKGNIG